MMRVITDPIYYSSEIEKLGPPSTDPIEYDRVFEIDYKKSAIFIYKNDDYFYVKCEIYISMISRTKMKYNNYYYKCDQLNNLLKLLSKEIPKLS